ncbi:carboxypeptidase-like regulatory domain-containing protein [Actinoplanes couchii]|uniref:alpha-amylase n=1 Tax=Actinoplanes couchii TaxID=403638 RepID=A0ABQ3XQH8_9ACTN|nr:carboxypeptidase-like regulatory domain-containing protein [Actinoplanes couchii]MDR6317461.1 hypothetical protein [Actinoplanes couchii]GID60762.1 hypothetical protein Aco03nite_091660 [Actinoplanes couchii]
MSIRRIITGALVAGFVAATAVMSPAVAAPTTGVIAGKLTTSSGAPAAGIPVTVDDAETARPWYTTTDTAGRWSLRVPPGSSYVVSFVDGSYRQYSPQVLEFADATRHTVRAGRTERIRESLLEAASLTGRLTDAAGAPVGNARVSLLTSYAFELWTTTDADGGYRFDKLAPGAVKISFHLADGRVQWAHQKPSWDEADEIVLTLGGTATVDDQLL